MIDLDLYIAFIITAIFIVVIPGPSILFVIARTLNLGLKGGLLSIAGLAIGGLCHALAVTLGLAQLLASYPEYFIIVKNLGCIYLVYLGIKTFLTRDKKNSDSENKGSDSKPDNHAKNLMKQGVIVELLNPKTALFFLAFLPQFINKSIGNVGIQLIILGITFVAMALLNDIIYALLASRIGKLLKRSAVFKKTEKYFSGSIFCSLGIVGLFYKISKE